MIIGIAGGSGSGKTTFALLLQNALGTERCSLLQQDFYYRNHCHLFDYDGGSVNFDHPDAIDFSLLSEHLRRLKAGLSVRVPVYDFETHSCRNETQTYQPRQIILVEGMLLLSQRTIREALDVAVFIDVPEQVRYERRLARDARERARDPDGIRRQFKEHVKPMHDLFVERSKGFADWVYSGETAMEPNIRDLLFRIGDSG